MDLVTSREDEHHTLEDMMQEIVGMLHNEVKALIAEGVHDMQLDSRRYVIQLAQLAQLSRYGDST